MDLSERTGRDRRVVAYGAMVSMVVGCVGLKTSVDVPNPSATDAAQDGAGSAKADADSDSASRADAALNGDGDAGQDSGAGQGGDDAEAVASQDSPNDQSAADEGSGGDATLEGLDSAADGSANGDAALDGQDTAADGSAEGGASLDGPLAVDVADAGDGDAWTYIQLEAGTANPSSSWVAIPGCASDIAPGWMIGCDHSSLFEWNPALTSWQLVAGVAAYKVSVDLNGIPWLIRPDGQILKWTGSAFAPFGGETFCAMGVASGTTDTETWALQCGGGATSRWNGVSWESVPGAGLKIAVNSAIDPVCNTHLPVVLGTNEVIFYYWCATGGFVFNLADPTSIVADYAVDISTDLIIYIDGTVRQWSGFPVNPNDSPWTTRVAAPWGDSSRFGAWGGWVFAMSLDTGSIAMIAP